MKGDTGIPHSKRVYQQAYTYLVGSIMPVEIMLSFPVFVKRDSQLVAAFFAGIARPLDDRSNVEVFQPTAKVYVDWEGEQVLEHERSPVVVDATRDRPVALLNPVEFAGTDRDRLADLLLDAREEVFALLDQVAPLYDRSRLTKAQKELVSRCGRAYRRMVPPGLWPFYEELNPQFFQWLGGSDTTESSCPQCGAANPAGSRFCSQCGAKLAS